MSRRTRRTSAIAACALLGISLTGCTICTEQLVDETTSPDHQWTTRTTTRDCGPLATPTTIVYLQRADSRATLGEIAVLVRHVHPLQINWASARSIDVRCPACGEDVKIARAQVRGIIITIRK